jgi:protocatechuate 3,4-dioxygenase beta subunit
MKTHSPLTDADRARLTRRDLFTVGGGFVGLVGSGFAGLASKIVWPQRLVYPFPSTVAGASGLAATPSCTDLGEATESEDEGPFYTPNTPLRSDFRQPGSGGRPLLLRGQVVDQRCQPIPNAVLDLWHVNEHAIYDNVHYGYRGHQFTAADGTFELKTIVPVAYTFATFWRVPHIHLKLQGPNTRPLTTQLYFSDPTRATDHVRVPSALRVSLQPLDEATMVGFFRFVLVTR